ncbi:pre-mRNA splicing factor SR-like protein 1 isoform X1 [Tanacetum coccineum]
MLTLFHRPKGIRPRAEAERGLIPSSDQEREGRLQPYAVRSSRRKKQQQLQKDSKNSFGKEESSKKNEKERKTTSKKAARKKDSKDSKDCFLESRKVARRRAKERRKESRAARAKERNRKQEKIARARKTKWLGLPLHDQIQVLPLSDVASLGTMAGLSMILAPRTAFSGIHRHILLNDLLGHRIDIFYCERTAYGMIDYEYFNRDRIRCKEMRVNLGYKDDNNGCLCTGPDDMACRPPSVKDALSGESTRRSDDMARRPPPVKDALSVSFGQRAPHRASTRDSSPVQRL